MNLIVRLVGMNLMIKKVVIPLICFCFTLCSCLYFSKIAITFYLKDRNIKLNTSFKLLTFLSCPFRTYSWSMKKNVLLLLLLIALGACKDEKVGSVLELFSEERSLFQGKSNIEEDSLALVEGLTCDTENIIVYDLHSGNSYTLFDKKTGAYITRFGTIGQGPDEIPSGCYGYLLRKCFSVFDGQTGIVAKYNLDSLRANQTMNVPERLAKFHIPDAHISRLIAVDDTTFFGAGIYKSRYQYVLFNKKNEVLSYGIDVYNALDERYNQYTRFLSNQGDLVMQPGKKVFAYSVNFSSNLDIVEVIEDEIRLVKSLRLGNPINKSMGGDGLYQSVDLTKDSQTGYINLSATAEHIYALYSDKQMFENGRKSSVVLVFDWKGNAIKKYSLDTEAHYITVDEDGQSMYAAVKNEEGGWCILCYTL